jgi:hypothetical protein
MRRPTEAAARKAIEAWLDEYAPGYPCYGLCEDGDACLAFWVAEQDTTSYVHADLSIEWYGTGWPDLYDINEGSGLWREKPHNT